MGVALFHPEHPIFGGTSRGENLLTDKYAQMKIRRGSAGNRFFLPSLASEKFLEKPTLPEKSTIPLYKAKRVPATPMSTLGN